MSGLLIAPPYFHFEKKHRIISCDIFPNFIRRSVIIFSSERGNEVNCFIFWDGNFKSFHVFLRLIIIFFETLSVTLCLSHFKARDRFFSVPVFDFLYTFVFL